MELHNKQSGEALCGCYQSELCGYIHSADSVAKRLLKQKKTMKLRDLPEFFQ
jgi:hypothetical protein